MSSIVSDKRGCDQMLASSLVNLIVYLKFKSKLTMRVPVSMRDRN